MTRAWLTRLGAMIDSETVRLYRAVMYTCFLWGGIYMTLWGHAPTTVQAALGSGLDHVWKALLVVCPLLVFVGSHLPRLRAHQGLWLQFSGDVGVTFALITYCIAVLQSPWWGSGTFALWGYIGLAVCTTVVAVRDVRQLRAVGRLAKEL